jgi:hypothetical protein
MLFKVLLSGVTSEEFSLRPAGGDDGGASPRGLELGSGAFVQFVERFTTGGRQFS